MILGRVWKRIFKIADDDEEEEEDVLVGVAVKWSW